MNYLEKSGLDTEKFLRVDIHNEYNTLKIDIERMFFTNDMSELNQMYDVAKSRIDTIYDFHLERVKKLQSIIGGTEQCEQ